MVVLTEIAGRKVVRGGNRLIDGCVMEKNVRDLALERMKERGFLHKDSEEEEAQLSMEPVRKRSKTSSESSISDLVLRVPRRKYASMYGPTAGDILRLGDTCLLVRIERDFTVYGDECVFGGGKVLREGMGQATGKQRKDSNGGRKRHCIKRQLESTVWVRHTKKIRS